MFGKKNKVYIDLLKINPLKAYEASVNRMKKANDQKEQDSQKKDDNHNKHTNEEKATQTKSDTVNPQGVSDTDSKPNPKPGPQKSPSPQEKFEELVDTTTNVLYRLSNIIPFLNSEIVIDASKITIIQRPFFFSERIQTIAIKDLVDVYIDTVPFLATMNLKDGNFVNKALQIKWIWKGDAEKARRIITGLMQAMKQEVYLKMIHDDDFLNKVEEIGRIRNTVTSVN